MPSDMTLLGRVSTRIVELAERLSESKDPRIRRAAKSMVQDYEMAVDDSPEALTAIVVELNRVGLSAREIASVHLGAVLGGIPDELDLDEEE